MSPEHTLPAVISEFLTKIGLDSNAFPSFLEWLEPTCVGDVIAFGMQTPQEIISLVPEPIFHANAFYIASICAFVNFACKNMNYLDVFEDSDLRNQIGMELFAGHRFSPSQFQVHRGPYIEIFLSVCQRLYARGDDAESAVLSLSNQSKVSHMVSKSPKSRVSMHPHSVVQVQTHVPSEIVTSPAMQQSILAFRTQEVEHKTGLKQSPISLSQKGQAQFSSQISVLSQTSPQEMKMESRAPQNTTLDPDQRVQIILNAHNRLEEHLQEQKDMHEAALRSQQEHFNELLAEQNRKFEAQQQAYHESQELNKRFQEQVVEQKKHFENLMAYNRVNRQHNKPLSAI